MYLSTVRITEAFGLYKLSLFCNVQRDVASLPYYSKLNMPEIYVQSTPDFSSRDVGKKFHNG